MKAQLLDRSIVLDAVDRPALVAELEAMGLSPSVDPTGLLRVAYSGTTAQDLIGRIDTPLSVLRVHDPSLEEAYVELLREPEEALA